jgi:competence protein ComGF
LKIIQNLKKEYVHIGSKGFTLIEALLGFTAFCMIGAILPIVFHILSQVDQSKSRLQMMQWEVFSNQVKKEIRMSQKLNPQSNKLFLTRDADSILYEQNGTNIRRRVNLTGNEILLQNISNVKFISVTNGVIIETEDVWKNKYSMTIRSFIEVGK